MFVHKYEAAGDTFYRISKEPKPGEIVNLSPDNWKERRQTSTGKISNALGMLQAAFSEEEPEKEEKPAEKKAGLISIAQAIRSLQPFEIAK